MSRRVRGNREYWEGELIPGSRCPRSGCHSPLAYDGTYWCTVCDWVLPDERATRAEKDAFNVAYVLLMQQRGEEPDPSALE